jgi:hypothetical protein
MVKTEYYSIPAIVTNQLYDYLSDANIELPVVKLVKIIYDYLKTIKLIYSEEQADRIATDTKRKLIELIACTITNNLEDDGTIELSRVPEILIHYKKVDSDNILYRIRYMKKVAITEWKLIDARTVGIPPNRYIAEEIFSIAEKLLE